MTEGGEGMVVKSAMLETEIQSEQWQRPRWMRYLFPRELIVWRFVTPVTVMTALLLLYTGWIVHGVVTRVHPPGRSTWHGWIVERDMRLVLLRKGDSPASDEETVGNLWAVWIAEPRTRWFPWIKEPRVELHGNIRAHNLTPAEIEDWRPEFEKQSGMPILPYQDYSSLKGTRSQYINPVDYQLWVDWDRVKRDATITLFVFALVWCLAWWWVGSKEGSTMNYRIYRLRRGICPSCSYDIRGLPDTRCPECGTEWTQAELDRSRTRAARSNTI
ncbi:MAG: hypothetical protein D8M59_07150 [Planctomycetes bacterium]|nr:hypothetical protein [Planctomycetota bacterium]